MANVLIVIAEMAVLSTVAWISIVVGQRVWRELPLPDRVSSAAYAAVLAFFFIASATILESLQVQIARLVVGCVLILLSLLLSRSRSRTKRHQLPD